MDCQNNLAEPRSGYSCEVIIDTYENKILLLLTLLGPGLISTHYANNCLLYTSDAADE